MAIVIPVAVTAVPERQEEAGLAHLDAQMQAAIEGQNHCIGYAVRHLWSQGWAAGECRTTSNPGYTDLVDALMFQRLSTRGVKIHCLATSDGGGTVRFTCLETGTSATIAFAAGTSNSSTTLAITRANLLSTWTVAAFRGAGGTFLDILSIAIQDQPLTVATMP